MNGINNGEHPDGIIEAIQDDREETILEVFLTKTSAIIVVKWHFDPAEHKKYAEKIISCFENPDISDLITRVALVIPVSSNMTSGFFNQSEKEKNVD